MSLKSTSDIVGDKAEKKGIRDEKHSLKTLWQKASGIQVGY